MIIYVIDVDGMKDDVNPDTIHPMDDGEETLPELIYLHKDLIRGCTNSYITMKSYYEDMQRVVGKYVNLIVYEYDIKTSMDLPPALREFNIVEGEEIDDSTLSAIGLTLYTNPERNETPHDAASMPVLIKYPLETGDIYVVNSAAQEVFNEIYFTECEWDVLFKLAALFICLKNYIKPLRENSDLVEMFDVLSGEFSELKYDFYDPSLRWHIDPIALNKMHIDSLDVFKR